MTGEISSDDFADHRGRLFAIAYRILGNSADADDAVQDTWLRFDRTDTSEVLNLGGWLTTVNTRVCLNMLRDRAPRRQASLDTRVPDLVVESHDACDPEQQALLADSVSLALLVVLETLSPSERVALVLHDVFGVSFDEIALMVDRSPEAARKLASRARIRVQASTPSGTARERHREVVDAFFDAARAGNIERLIAVLHPDVVLRSDGGDEFPAATAIVRGASNVAQRAAMFARSDTVLTPVMVNGTVGTVVATAGTTVAIMAFTMEAGRIATIESLSDPSRIGGLNLEDDLPG